VSDKKKAKPIEPTEAQRKKALARHEAHLRLFVDKGEKPKK